MIRPQRQVLRDLEKVKERYLSPEMDLEIYFDDVVDAHERIWDMLENYKEVIEALEDTNESVLSHRVNDILRVLTSITVIVLPLTLLASIWGMNVGVPGERDPRSGSSSAPWWSCWSGWLPTSADGVGCDARVRVGVVRAARVSVTRLMLVAKPSCDAPSTNLGPWRLEYVKDASKDNESECIFCAGLDAGDDDANLIVSRGERAFVILNKYRTRTGT